MQSADKRKNQSGYTLIEVVIGATLFLAVFTVFGAYLLRLTRAQAQFTESAKVTEDINYSVATLRTDLERTGRNLTVSTAQPFASSGLNVNFLANTDFAFGSGSLRRVSGTSAATANVQFRGNASLNFSASNFAATVAENNGGVSWSLSRSWSGGTENLTVIENGTIVFQKQNQSVPETANANFKFTVAVAGGISNCLSTVSIRDQVLYQNSYPCSENYKRLAFDVPVGAQATNINLAASQILQIDAPAAVLYGLLPKISGRRMTIPVVAESNGDFVLLAGDSKLDPFVLAANARFDASTSPVPLSLNDANGIVAGDRLMINDFGNKRSVILSVVEVSGSSLLLVAPVYRDGSTDTVPGDGLSDISVYSDVADFSGFTFERGSRVVKLSSPVQYRVSDDQKQLFRRTAGGAWQLVLPAAENFSLQIIQSSDTSFDVSYRIASEGVESAQSTQDVHFTVAPRALNRTLDVR